ncbi:MAG: oxidoreductase [Subtercola sp.]|nr:oxidoreductase [Subtercola sp.]
MTAPIRAAVIGYGLAGRVFHTSLIAADERYSLDAIVTSDPGRVLEAKTRFPAATIFESVDALLAQHDSFDLAVVAAPTPQHASLAAQTIESGLATVVDKPLAVRASEIESLIDSASNRGVLLTAFHNRRWDGDFLTVQKLLAEGKLGDVWRFESRFEWLNPRARPAWKSGTTGAAGGGVAYDLGSHLIDQAIQLFGPVADVYGELDQHRTDSSNDDDSFIALTHDSGVRSHLWMSSLVAQRGPRFRMLGSGSAYTKWGLDPQESQLAAGLSTHDAAFGTEEPAAFGRLGTDGQTEQIPTEHGGYTEFYGQLAEAMLHGSPVPVDPRDTLRPVQILEQLHSGHQ